MASLADIFGVVETACARARVRRRWIGSRCFAWYLRVGGLGASALCTGGCGAGPVEQPGQLIVALSADMSIPKDISDIIVRIWVGTSPHHQRRYSIQPTGDFQLPGTVSVVEGSIENPTIAVEVTGIRRSSEQLQVRTFGKSVLTIPSGRVSLLQVPIQWLCDGQAQTFGDDTEVGPSAISTCASERGREQACVAGVCRSVEILSSMLPHYDPAQVFGGGQSGTDPRAQCFPTLDCFANSFRVEPDLADCTLEIDELPERAFNFALELDAPSDGICADNGQCFIPLDKSAVYGWTENEQQNLEDGRRHFQLPVAVCQKIEEWGIHVRATTSCDTKTLSTPTCGPWSAIATPAPSCNRSSCESPCGNGRLDAGEDCDGANLGGKSCASEAFASGNLRCTSACRLDTAGCIATEARCGDGRVDEDEQCDGAQLDGATCATVAPATGTLVCGSNCRFDTTGCTSTVDGVWSATGADVEQRDPADRAFTRYVSLTNRYNSGRRGDELDLDRQALNKLLNSLSTRSVLAAATPVDLEQTLYRIDIRDYGWDREVDVQDVRYASGWELLVAALEIGEFEGPEANAVEDATGTKGPILWRADALVSSIASSEIYYALTGAGWTLAEQETQIATGAAGPFDGSRLRAGFIGSALTTQSRLVERRGLSSGGAYWQAFDFIERSADPFTLGDSLTSDGLLAIYSLPNGLTGYFAAGTDGSRIGGSNVLLPTSETTVPLDCMRCHARGVTAVTGEWLPSIAGEPVESGIATYADATTIATIVATDQMTYATALGRLGVPTGGEEPVSAVYRRFGGDLTLAEAAADLGTTEPQLRETAENDLFFYAIVGAILDDAAISRSTVEELVRTDLCALTRTWQNVPVACANP
jgi:hypothetical protein